MNSSLLVPTEPVSLPDIITTDWKRFSSGLWRIPEGDIAAAYCADTFPKIKVFTHAGIKYANCGCHYSHSVQSAADCYPLVSFAEYRGPEPAQYTYEGRVAILGKVQFKLGRKVVFKSSDPSVQKLVLHFRVLYADGGFFAHGVTYREFLERRITAESENERLALEQELTECATGLMPRTQPEMQRLLEEQYPVVKQRLQMHLGF